MGRTNVVLLRHHNQNGERGPRTASDLHRYRQPLPCGGRSCSKCDRMNDDSRSRSTCSPSFFLTRLAAYASPTVRRAWTPHPRVEKRLPHMFSYSLFAFSSSALLCGFLYRRPAVDPTWFYSASIICIALSGMAFLHTFKSGRRVLRRAFPLPRVAVLCLAAVVALASGIASYHNGRHDGELAKGSSKRSANNPLSTSELFFGLRYYWVCPVETATPAKELPLSLFLAESGESFVLWSDSTGTTYMPSGSTILKDATKC